MSEEYKAVAYGIKRSGSTAIYQITSQIFGKTEKTHTFIETSLPIVATYRDFRAAMVSLWRIGEEFDTFSTEAINKYYRHFKSQVRILHKYKRYYSDNILFLRYEDWFDDPSIAIDNICTKFNISISKSLKDTILDTTSLACNKKRSAKFSSFKEYDPDSHIHGKHIHSSSLDSWKKFVSEECMARMNSLLHNELQAWGYE